MSSVTILLGLWKNSVWLASISFDHQTVQYASHRASFCQRDLQGMVFPLLGALLTHPDAVFLLPSASHLTAAPLVTLTILPGTWCLWHI